MFSSLLAIARKHISAPRDAAPNGIEIELQPLDRTLHYFDSRIRRELIAWLEREAPDLVEPYKGAVVLLHSPHVGGR